MKRFGLLILLMACGSESDPQRQRSTPVSQAKPNLVALDLAAIHRPDGKEVLTASQLSAADISRFLPAINDLQPTELSVLLEAVNLTTAACEPCLTDGVSLGSCALRALPTCSDLPTLIQRAFRVAIQGGDLAEVQKAVSFVEPWQDLSELVGDSNAEVHVVFAVDYLDPFSHRAWTPWVTLMAEYGDALKVHILHLPQDRHPGSKDFARRVLSAGESEQAQAMHMAIMAAGETPNLAQFDSKDPDMDLVKGDALAAALKKHHALAQKLQVDSTPVVWINGYRLSGQRKIALLQQFVDLALADGRNQEL
jgi:hypothetical protein